MKNNPTPAHETTDTPTRPVWITGLALAISCVVIAFIVTLLFNHLQRRSETADRNAAEKAVVSSVAASEEQFPAPRLQIIPEADLAAWRAREDGELNHYGWIDKKAGIVRIPIERAMDLIVQRGLPVNGQPGAPLPYRTTQDLLREVKTLEHETPTPSPASSPAPLERKMKRTAIFILCLICAAQVGTAQLTDADLRQIKFDQKPGAQISPGLQFLDENGKPVKIGGYLGRRPVILVPGYYKCPMLCTLVLNGLVESMQDLRGNIGEEFDVVNFSIDPSETPQLAAAKKAAYLRRYGRPGAATGWHFLTGDEAAIRKLCGEIGFHYAYDPVAKQYAHPSGFVVLTPQGKIVRYFFGVDFPGKDLDGALVSASANKAGSPIRQLLLLCFHYSPVTGKYGNLILYSVRACGIVTLAFLGVLIARGIGRKRTNNT